MKKHVSLSHSFFPVTESDIEAKLMQWVEKVTFRPDDSFGLEPRLSTDLLKDLKHIMAQCQTISDELENAAAAVTLCFQLMPFQFRQHIFLTTFPATLSDDEFNSPLTVRLYQDFYTDIQTECLIKDNKSEFLLSLTSDLNAFAKQACSPPITILTNQLCQWVREKRVDLEKEKDTLQKTKQKENLALFRETIPAPPEKHPIPYIPFRETWYGISHATGGFELDGFQRQLEKQIIEKLSVHDSHFQHLESRRKLKVKEDISTLIASHIIRNLSSHSSLFIIKKGTSTGSHSKIETPTIFPPKTHLDNIPMLERSWNVITAICADYGYDLPQAIDAPSGSKTSLKEEKEPQNGSSRSDDSHSNTKAVSSPLPAEEKAVHAQPDNNANNPEKLLADNNAYIRRSLEKGMRTSDILGAIFPPVAAKRKLSSQEKNVKTSLLNGIDEIQRTLKDEKARQTALSHVHAVCRNIKIGTISLLNEDGSLSEAGQSFRQKVAATPSVLRLYEADLAKAEQILNACDSKIAEVKPVLGQAQAALAELKSLLADYTEKCTLQIKNTYLDLLRRTQNQVTEKELTDIREMITASNAPLPDLPSSYATDLLSALIQHPPAEEKLHRPYTLIVTRLYKTHAAKFKPASLSKNIRTAFRDWANSAIKNGAIAPADLEPLLTDFPSQVTAGTPQNPSGITGRQWLAYLFLALVVIAAIIGFYQLFWAVPAAPSAQDNGKRKNDEKTPVPTTEKPTHKIAPDLEEQEIVKKVETLHKTFKTAPDPRRRSDSPVKGTPKKINSKSGTVIHLHDIENVHIIPSATTKPDKCQFSSKNVRKLENLPKTATRPLTVRFKNNDATLEAEHLLNAPAIYSIDHPDEIGYGTIRFNDGRIYKGQLKKGVCDGNGEVSYPDGIVYVGGFRDGYFHGAGRVLLGDETVWTGELTNGVTGDTGENVIEAIRIGILNGNRYT